MWIYSRIIEEIVLAIKQIHGFVDHRQIVYHIASTFLHIGMHFLWKLYVPMQIHCTWASVYALRMNTGSGCSTNEMCNISDSFCKNLALWYVYCQVFTQRTLWRQYHIAIENSNHSLYTENKWYEEHNIHIPTKTILRDELSIRKITYPIPDEHIVVIVCTLRACLWENHAKQSGSKVGQSFSKFVGR